MREAQIERQLVKAVGRKGGLALKFTSPGFAGVPDRIVLLPSGQMAFVELKAPGQPLRPLQAKRKRQLEALGFSVYRVDDPAEIPIILDMIRGDTDGTGKDGSS